MRTGDSAKLRIFAPIYRVFGRPSSEYRFQPDGPAVTGGIVERWRKRRRYRWHLQRIIDSSPELLADIGLTEKAAAEEVAKPFWRR